MNEKISRRKFLKGAAIGTAGLAVTSLLGCSPQTSEPASQSNNIKWDHEADLVIIGSGTGLYGALLASFKGIKTIVIEKTGIIGGTTITSGGMVWVPCNRWYQEATGKEWTEEEAMAYLKAGDLYNGSTDEQKLDYVRNFKTAIEYMEDEMGYPMMYCAGFGEYDKVPYALGEGHSIAIMDPETKERIRPSTYMPKMFVPKIEEAGNTILTETTAKTLIKDETGRVIGVQCETKSGTINIKGAKAVILAAGGFDYNEQMCKSFLRGPLFGTRVSVGCTGDGILMGMQAGAGLGNMPNTLGGSVYLDAYEPDTFFKHNVGFDFGSYRAGAYSITVNKHGRRFMDESVPYSNFPDAAYNFDTRDHSFTNIPAHLIFSEKHVELFKWPVGDTQPEWVQKFDTLDALAEYYKIDAENLKAEVERFNGFCETGVDLDFARGDNPWAIGQVKPVDGLINKCLGKIEAPYYCCLIGPGSLGTKGGVTINKYAQVLDPFGNIIEGLYAAGTNASAVLGWTYGGGGGGLGPGVYQSFRAIDHIFSLGIFKD